MLVSVLALFVVSCSGDDFDSKTALQEAVGDQGAKASLFYADFAPVMISLVEGGERPSEEDIQLLELRLDTMIAGQESVTEKLVSLSAEHSDDELLTVSAEYAKSCGESFMVTKKLLAMIRADEDLEEIKAFIGINYREVLEEQKRLENEQRALFL